MAKQTIEEEINSFIEMWGYKEQIAFFRDSVPLLELYDVIEGDDWVHDSVGGDIDNARTVRLIRTVYLVSKLAEFHAGLLCTINVRFKHLWRRLEKLDNGKMIKEST